MSTLHDSPASAAARTASGPGARPAARPSSRPAPEPSARPSARPFRRTLAVAEALVALGALLGTVMLVSGVGTPPVSAIEGVGLHSWVLPGLWLLASVAVPSTVAAWLAAVGSPHAPDAVLVASALLVVELAVQLPFLGFSLFQLVFGAVAVVLAVIALAAKDTGGWER